MITTIIKSRECRAYHEVRSHSQLVSDNSQTADPTHRETIYTAARRQNVDCKQVSQRPTGESLCLMPHLRTYHYSKQ